MSNGIYSAVSGAVAQTQRIDVLANNLANISTPGFKADGVSFSEVLAKASAGGVPEAGSFVASGNVQFDLRPGTLLRTDNPTDLALEGPGYLCLRSGEKELYTRGGSMTIRGDGVLADHGGLPVLGMDNQPVRVGQEGGELTVGRNGEVFLDGAQVGQLKLVEFAQPYNLQRQGGIRYAAPGGMKAQPAAATTVRQGQLEQSNVNPIREVSSLVVASRTYEAFQRVISTFKEIETRTATTLGQRR